MSIFQVSDKYRTQCAFWNYSVNDMRNGSWSSEGCERTYSNDTHTSCRCSHLTHFAILMSSSTSIVSQDWAVCSQSCPSSFIVLALSLPTSHHQKEWSFYILVGANCRFTGIENLGFLFCFGLVLPLFLSFSSRICIVRNFQFISYQGLVWFITSIRLLVKGNIFSLL